MTPNDDYRDRDDEIARYVERNGETCVRGHLWWVHGFIVETDNRVRCRECKRAAGRAYKKRQQEKRRALKILARRAK